MKDGNWRMFLIDKRDATAQGCNEIIRIHLMENESVSFGFVEQRVGLLRDVWFLVYCGAANIAYEPAPSLRDGMNILEWLWQNRKEKEHE